MEAALAETVPTFEPPDVTVPVTARVPRSTSEAIDQVVKLWRMLAKARGADAETIKQVDKSHVLRRLLRVGAEQAFAEVGVDVDSVLSGDTDWADVERAIAVIVAKSKR